MTTALCNTCLDRIPANYAEINGGTYLVKKCPVHGLQTAMVEKDAAFFNKMHHPQNKIFDGHFIEVTGRCNMDCSYCYHPKGQDRDRDSIIAEAKQHDCTIYLTGGEPTLRADLPDIITEIGKKVYLPTNGTGLLDIDYMHRLFAVIGEDDGHKGIALSYHSEYPELFESVMHTVKAQAYKITSVIFTISEVGQLTDCLEIADRWRDEVLCFRVHCATALWNAKTEPLFLSDVLQKFDGELLPEQSKSVWVLALRNNKLWAFCHWDTIGTLDLENTACGPTTSSNGEIYHLTEGFIRNGHAC